MTCLGFTCTVSVISAYANLNVNFNDPSITYSQIQTESIQSGRIEPNHEIKEDTVSWWMLRLKLQPREG